MEECVGRCGCWDVELEAAGVARDLVGDCEVG